MRHATHGVLLEFAEKTDPGLDPTKQENEDSTGSAVAPLGFVAVLCDGMGGHASGQQASATAVRTLLDFFAQTTPQDPPAEAIADAIQAAGQAVYALGGTAPRDVRPGSTCVVALLSDRGLLVGHVGDSRALLLRGQSAVRLTRDHSLVQQMVDAGVIGPEEALSHPDANRITRALGMTPDANPELSPEWITLQPGDIVLLASDGLTDVVEDRELLVHCSNHEQVGLAAVCDKLVELARLRGGPDNITVQSIGVVEVPRVHGTLRLDGSGNAATTVLGLDTGPNPRIAEADAPARIGVGPTVLDLSGTDINQRTTLPGPAVSPPIGIAPHVPPLGSPPSRRTRSAWPWLLLLLVLGAIGVGLYSWLNRPREEEAIPAPEPRPKPSVIAPLPSSEAIDAAVGTDTDTPPTSSGQPPHRMRRPGRSSF